MSRTDWHCPSAWYVRRVQPVFHIDRLKKYEARQAFVNSEQPLQTVTEEVEDDNDVSEQPIVESVVDERTVKVNNRNEKQYCVMWFNKPEHEATWEPEARIRAEAADALREYERQKQDGLMAVRGGDDVWA